MSSVDLSSKLQTSVSNCLPDISASAFSWMCKTYNEFRQTAPLSSQKPTDSSFFCPLTYSHHMQSLIYNPPAASLFIQTFALASYLPTSVVTLL